ncbi:metal-dependent hydrolase [Kitasatospora sp. NPDC008115]|uniref:metal-dependent hydrolase n=1 Tax=Kitasatospora sp. NPDC008115 TaxID=3364022 RepID=UPI0036EFA166
MAHSQLDDVKPTFITYPTGSCREEASVLAVLETPRENGPAVVVTDVSPFHPLDPLWPDQPADHGELTSGERVFRVSDTVTVARRPGGPVMVGNEVDARRDEPDVLFVVGQVVDAAAAEFLAPGTRVTLAVDEARRLRLSAAHTACHLLAYALNEATHGLWRKETGADSRGHHDFDAATCVLTRHDEGGSLDRYRLGKSLRKRGFDVARFLDELPGIVERTNGTLAHWITTDAPVRVDCLGPRLTDRRQWVCETPGGTAQMPCGGTHVERLGQIASMTAQASYDADDGILTIRNEVRTHRAAR